MNVDTDRYIVATHALWAGDFEKFEALLRDFSPATKHSRRPETAETPEDFIKATGSLRLRQFWQKRSEFGALTEEYADSNVQITDKPTILETAHLRAALWRMGEREFLMQGYLTDLKWEQNLFARAHKEARKSVTPEKSFKKQPTLGFMPEERSRMSPGCAWVQVGNPFLQVELTDLALLEASGLWLKRQLPEQAAEITKAFQSVLNALDESQPLKYPEQHETIQ